MDGVNGAYLQLFSRIKNKNTHLKSFGISVIDCELSNNELVAGDVVELAGPSGRYGYIMVQCSTTFRHLAYIMVLLYRY